VNATTQEFAQHLVAGVVNSLPVGIAIALLTAGVLRLMRQANASARFAVWFFALASLPALAFFHGPITTITGVHTRIGIDIPGSWALPVVAIWAAIAGAILARIAAGVWRIWEIRRSCVTVSGEELPARVLALLSSHSSRKIELCTSNLVDVPAAFGLFRPAIVLPAWALKDLSRDQLSAIIGHELAHLQRWDDWSNLAQKILRAVFFFHPAAWWIERELSLAREMACDDAAVTHAQSARHYAASLVAVAEKSMIRRGLLLAQAAVHRARETSIRVARLLNLNGRGARQSWKPAGLTLGALAAAVFVIEPQMPQLIAFHDDSPVITASTTPAAPAARLMTESSSRAQSSLLTQATYRENNAGRTVPASMKAAPKTYRRPALRKTQPQPEMLVIFQNASFDQQGMPTWNVYVLRVKWTQEVQVVNREPSKRT